MAQRRSTPRGTRTSLLDHLLVAGIIGGALYLLLHTVLTAPVPVAAAVGLVGFGFALGTEVRVPRIVWRRRR